MPNKAINHRHFVAGQPKARFAHGCRLWRRYVSESLIVEDKSEIVERLERGIFLRDFSGRLSYEIQDMGSEHYFPTRKDVAKRFGLFPFGITINTPDEAFKTYIKGFKRIGIEWDWASGFTVVAKNTRAEPLILAIGHYLESSK
tara:strand:- start:1033 stop:1464 length:432 start_codon:yes stop_codon:yes gene_type:complete